MINIIPETRRVY